MVSSLLSRLEDSTSRYRAERRLLGSSRESRRSFSTFLFVRPFSSSYHPSRLTGGCAESPTGRISPIQGITIEALSLAFDPAAPYAPTANSSKVSAAFGLPFGFSLNIVQLANQFAIVSNRTAVATLEAPMGDAQTTLLQQNAGGTSGTIRLDLPVAPLGIGPSYTEHL